MNNHHNADRTMQQQAECASCGNLFKGSYCNACGEKLLSSHDFAVKHYLEETFEGFTHFDTRFFRSIKLLLTRPGVLSECFSSGKRVGFVKPFQLFLLCNLVYFLFVGTLNTFSVPLSAFKDYTPYTYFGTQHIISTKAATAQQYQLLATAFNEKVGTESKVFIALFIPVFAFSFWLLFNRKRRYFSEHLVFATHFFSFMLLYYTLSSVFISKPFYWIYRNPYNSTYDLVISMITLVIFGGYFAMAAKRFYKVNFFYAVGSGVLTTLLFVVAMFGYRMLLFYKVIAGIHLGNW